MTRRRPAFPDLPEPEKPVREMTSAKRGAYVRDLRRALRDDEVRSGSRRPQTMREFEIAREGRLERGQQSPQDGLEGITAEHLPGNATAADVGQWMAGCLERDGHLDQRDVAHGLAGRFGDRFTFVTEGAPGHLRARPPGLPQGRRRSAVAPAVALLAAAGGERHVS